MQSIKKNYLYTLAYQIMTIVIPLLTTPYIARILGADGVGMYSYTASIVAYFISFAILGSTGYAQREIAYLQSNKEKYTKIFCEIFILRIITAGISLLVFALVIIQTDNKVIYLIQGLNILSVAVDINWFFQGLEEFKKIVLRNFIIRIISLILIFTLVKKAEDLWIYILIIASITFLGNLSIWGYLPKYLSRIKIKELQPYIHLKGVLQLYLPTLAIQIYVAMDKTMLGLYTDTTFENGYYEQADKIVKMCLLIVTSLSTVMAPRISYTLSNNDEDALQNYMHKTFRGMMFISIPMCFGLIIIADMVVPWFLGTGYEKTILLIKICSLWLIFIGISNIAGNQFLIQDRKQRIFNYSVFSGAFINLIFNFMLIPRYYSIGAAISSVLAEATVAAAQIIYIVFYDKRLKFKEMFRGTIKYIVGASGMFIVLSILKIFLKASLSGTILLMAVGILIYILLLMLLKEEFVIYGKEKIKSMVEERNRD